VIERCYLYVTLKSGANCNVCDPLNSQEKPKNSLKESIRRTRATFTFALDYQGQRAWGQLVAGSTSGRSCMSSAAVFPILAPCTPELFVLKKKMRVTRCRGLVRTVSPFDTTYDMIIRCTSQICEGSHFQGRESVHLRHVMWLWPLSRGYARRGPMHGKL
jgi:hypothetical protein